jgi:integrase/recombinase XerC
MFHEETFLNYLALERRFSPHTLKAYRNDLLQFLNFLGNTNCLTSVSEVRHLHIRAWIVEQMQSGQSPRSINRRLSCLKSYFKYLKKRGLLEKDPMQKVAAPRSGKRLPVFVPEAHMAELFRFAEFGPEYLPQCRRLILEMLYATGLRRSELIQLKLTDIDLSRMVFRVQGKGGKERLAPLAPYMVDLLEGFLQLRKATFPGNHAPWLLLNKSGEQLSPDFVYYTVKKYLSAITTVEQRSPHVLRHSFATHLSNAGAELNAIKELLGHSSLAATQVYMHNSIERLKKVYEQAHPKGEKSEE